MTGAWRRVEDGEKDRRWVIGKLVDIDCKVSFTAEHSSELKKALSEFGEIQTDATGQPRSRDSESGVDHE